MSQAVALACLALLAGCAPLQPAHPPNAPVALPMAWSAPPSPAGVPADAAWWARFRDATLLRLLDEAAQANPRVEGAQAALRQARALAAEGAAGLQPQLGSRASAQRTRGSGNLFQVGLDAGWELDLFGGQRAGVRALDAAADASETTLADVQISLAAEVALRYLALRGLQARIAVAQRNLDGQQQTEQIADWRAQAGLLSTLEREQARSARAQTAAALPLLRSNAQQAVHALAVLTGQPPAALNELLQAPAPLPLPDAALALALPAQTLRQRPDVRSAELQVRAALARFDQAEAARWPGLRLNGSLGLQSLTLAGLGSGPVLASLLASLSWPVWDGGATQARTQAQEAAAQQARSQLHATVLTALQEVEDALAALAGERERLLRLAEASRAAEAAAALAALRFRSGLVDFQTVLETQRSQLAVQDALATARTELASGHVRLFKALGGGWQAAQDAP